VSESGVGVESGLRSGGDERAEIVGGCDPQALENEGLMADNARLQASFTEPPPILHHSVAQSRKERWEDRQPSRFTCSRW